MYLTCGFASNIKVKIKPPDYEHIILHKVKLNTFYSGTCEIYLEKNTISLNNSPRERENSFMYVSDLVELRSYNNGTTIKVIDIEDNNIDYNTIYPFNSLRMLNIKKVSLDETCFENDIIVNCYEYIEFLKDHNIKFPYSDLYVLCNVPNLENAFWNGSYIVFGNGIEGKSHALVSPAIVGHELTHGLIQSSNHLEYNGESGALNEAYSDIFGVMFEFYLKEKRKEIGFELGSELFVDGHSMRSFRDPKKCGQPSNLREKYTGVEDNNGVHINSGIINHLFYKMQEIQDRKNIFNIFIKVFFKLKHNSKFIDFKNILLYYVDNSDLINIINEIL